MDGEKAFEAFCARFGQEAGDRVMDRITDAECGGSREGVIMSIHRHNACNVTLSGAITHAGEEFGFVIDSGDWAGTVIREWGPADEVGDYEPEQPTLFTFVPVNPDLARVRPALFRVYLLWREQPWFKDRVRGYNYDRYFAPGVKTEDHYRAFAASRGLKIATNDEAERIIARAAASPSNTEAPRP